MRILYARAWLLGAGSQHQLYKNVVLNDINNSPNWFCLSFSIFIKWNSTLFNYIEHVHPFSCIACGALVSIQFSACCSFAVMRSASSNLPRTNYCAAAEIMLFACCVLFDCGEHRRRLHVCGFMIRQMFVPLRCSSFCAIHHLSAQRPSIESDDSVLKRVVCWRESACHRSAGRHWFHFIELPFHWNLSLLQSVYVEPVLNAHFIVCLLRPSPKECASSHFA